MSGVEFATPFAFLLLAVPLLLFAFARDRTTRALLVPDSILGGREGAVRAGGAGLSWRLAAASLAWFCFVLALAGPRKPDAIAALPASGRDIMFALDLSGSMTKQDFSLNGAPVSRLALMKHVGSELIRRREGDRIGLVVFAETAYVAAPLTFDVRAVAAALNEMEIGIVGRSTAIGEGLGLALKRLLDSAAPTRIVILLSDGRNNAGSSEPAAVAELAQRIGVKIYTIGLGVEDTTTNPELFEAVDFATLQRVAEIGGGAAFRARTGDDLGAAAHAIEALEAGPSPAPPTVMFHDLWTYPATLAFIACVALAFGSSARR